MTNESADQRLLQLLGTSLRSSGVEPVADVVQEGGRLVTYDRRLALSAVVEEGRVGKVHAHVTAWLANAAATDGADMLDACIFGYGDTESEAMAEAADVWLHMVGAPVLSSLAARPLLGADHFKGNEPWGIPGGHGFVGPFMTRGQSVDVDMDALALSPAFELAGYPRDGRPHLAKVTLLAQNGVWERHLELDGHSPLARDTWTGISVPASPVMCTRFAVFFME